MPIRSAIPPTTVADRDLALLEAGQDDVVDDPADGEARRDRAEREHERAGDRDRERPWMEPDHRDDQVQPAPGALEATCRGSASPPRLSTSAQLSSRSAARSVERNALPRGRPQASRRRAGARRVRRRSGRTRCSSRPRNRSTRSATASGPPAPRRSARQANERHARSWPTSGASIPTTRRCSTSGPTSSTVRPTSSSRWSTTSSPSTPTDEKGRAIVPDWEADYRTYLQNRRDFADELRGGENVPFREAAYRRRPDQ